MHIPKKNDGKIDCFPVKPRGEWQRDKSAVSPCNFKTGSQGVALLM